jgi:hypothetical protein
MNSFSRLRDQVKFRTSAVVGLVTIQQVNPQHTCNIGNVGVMSNDERNPVAYRTQRSGYCTSFDRPFQGMQDD